MLQAGKYFYTQTMCKETGGKFNIRTNYVFNKELIIKTLLLMKVSILLLPKEI